jgi:amidohydrolase
VDDAVLARAVRMVLPQAGLEPTAELRSCGSDDFGYLAAMIPGLMMFLGLRRAQGTGKACGCQKVDRGC